MGKNIYMYGKKCDTLPKNGWIHSCINCNAPTSRTFKYFYDHKIYTCFFCKDCLYNKKDIELYTSKILTTIFNRM